MPSTTILSASPRSRSPSSLRAAWESGREMEGLSRKQDTKSFEVCVRHVTVDLEGREGACGGGRGNGPENVRFVCVDDGRDGHREAEGLRAFLDLIREDRESFGCDRSG